MRSFLIGTVCLVPFFLPVWIIQHVYGLPSWVPWLATLPTAFGAALIEEGTKRGWFE